MRLTTALQARKALARQMNLYKSGDIEGDVFVRLQRAFGTLLDYFKYERDEEFEKRLEHVEALLEEQEATKRR